ncbi:putative plant SNARE 13 [Camellia lanceoleosa]|uniref:Plant SNARE 13 n=1 Tax=Camellia lanceoleosa TaxID=1840588 RepID=A0ACC0FU29_9ERIC|nr:putative plant SNARE 13 [Camellia lanceoleosa]
MGDRHVSSLGNKRVELFDMGAGASDPTADGNVRMASGEIRTLFMSASQQFVEHITLKTKVVHVFYASRVCCY